MTLATTNSARALSAARGEGRESGVTLVEFSPRSPAAESPPRGLDFLSLWRVLSAQRWTILTSVMAGLAICLAVIFLSPRLYTAASTLKIDREAAKIVEDGEVTPNDNLVDGEEFYRTQYGLLKSRSLTVRVDESLGLDRDDAFIRAMGARPRDQEFAFTASGPDAVAAARRAQTLELLRKNLGVEPDRGSRLVAVSFKSPDPALSAKIANAFTENFIGAALDRRYQSSSYARDFLQRRLGDVKAKLEESERNLVDYAAKERIISINGGPAAEPSADKSIVAADLTSLDASLSAAKAARIDAEAKWREAQAVAGFGLPEILADPAVQKLSQEHAELLAKYQDQLRLYKPSWPAMLQLKAQIDETERQLQVLAAAIRGSIEARYKSAEANEAALSGQVNALEGNLLDLSKRSIEYAILQREVDTNRALYDGLLQRYKAVGAAGGATINNISIIDRAVPPSRASSPKPVFDLGLALIAGLVAGVILAFARESLDLKLRRSADVEARLGLPLLAAVPALEGALDPAAALVDPKSPLSESYQSLRSTLQFSTSEGFPASLVVTSPKSGDGKSTTVLALAANLASLGRRLLVIDADLRGPSLHRLFNLPNRSGLSNILVGQAGFEETIQAASIEGLSVITAGPPPPNPAELLAGRRFERLLAEAAEAFELVLLDSPPIMGLADAPMIASAAAGVLVVIEAGRTSFAEARGASDRLERARAHGLGVALTKFDARKAECGYGYDYSYGYGASAEQSDARGLIARLKRSA
ncbi:MAG: GumC family protein [Caulobacteraceae bacterium]